MSSGIRRPSRVAVFISGGGSTLQALLDMHHQIDIQLVVSNRKKASGILKAKRFGKPVFIQTKKTDVSFLQKILESYRIDKIVLAGYMKILPPEFVKVWAGRIMNIHPSLLPAYPGLDSAARSHEDQKNMGVTIHHVNAEMDSGKIFLQKQSASPVENFDQAEAFQFLRRTEQHLLRELGLRWLA